MQFTVGQCAVYVSTGKMVVIEDVHNDEPPPFYTVRCSDGREKQTLADKLAVPSAQTVEAALTIQRWWRDFPPPLDTVTADQSYDAPKVMFEPFSSAWEQHKGLNYRGPGQSEVLPLNNLLGERGPPPGQLPDVQQGVSAEAVAAAAAASGGTSRLRRVYDAGAGLCRSYAPSFVRMHPITSVWISALVVSSLICIVKPEAKSKLCLHWPSILNSHGTYRLASTFLCLGGHAFQMRGLMKLYFLSTNIASYETWHRFRGTSLRLVLELLFGMACLIALQYYGAYLQWYQTSILDARDWVPTRFWLSYDLVFYSMCCSCFRCPFEPTVLNIGFPIGPINQWKLPVVLSGIHLLTSGELAGLYLEAMFAAASACALQWIVPNLYARAVGTNPTGVGIHLNLD